MQLTKDHPFYNYARYASRQLAYAVALVVLGMLLDSTPAVVLGIVLLGFILFFFRNTPVVVEPGLAVSPSQSTVTQITHNVDPDGKHHVGTYHCIQTYLSPLDKHFLVGPVDGVVTEVKDHRQSDDLESIRLSIRDTNGLTHHFDQIVKKPGNWGYITGILVNKRVIVNKQKGDTIQKGERYGIIRFGSMMRYYIPTQYSLVIHKGDKLAHGSRLTSS